MKILIVGDVHWSQNSSIINMRGSKYSIRLENLIRSVNFCESQAELHHVDRVVYLGDFFDRPNLNDEEITALKELKWYNKIKHSFIVGNHESAGASLQYSSLYSLHDISDNFDIINTPKEESFGDISLNFIPYICESDRLPSISDYFQNKDNNHIVFSHNDVKGIRFGRFESKKGFDVKDLEHYCTLFINGHIHNNGYMNDGTLLNLGNLTGQNFSEDAFHYKHLIMILDTDTLDQEFIVNPYAFNFYKIAIDDYNQIEQLDLDTLNNIVSISTINNPELIRAIKTKCSTLSNVLTYRLNISYIDDNKASDNTEFKLDNIDYIKKAKEYFIEKLGTSKVVLDELNEVFK